MLQEYTVEELQIEYFMDAIEQDPTQAYPRGSDVQFRTGDELFDRWEELRAQGKADEIDYDEGIDKDTLERLKNYSRRVSEQHYSGLRQFNAEAGHSTTEPTQDDFDLDDLFDDEFTDDYTKDN